jgi:hypothetical protein
VREPKSITIQVTGLYLLLGTAGLSAIINPPNSVDGPLGPAYSVIWAWSMCLGGYGAAAFTPSGAWLWERPFLVLVTGAVSLYLYTIIAQAMSSTGMGNRWPQALVVSALLLWLLIRLQRILREPYEPGR